MLNLDTDTVVRAMEVMEDTVDMEVTVMENGLLMLNLATDTVVTAMEDMEDTVDMEVTVMEKGLLKLKLMLNQDTDTVVMAMEDTVDMEVMVTVKGLLKQMLNLVITEEAMVATVMEAMAEDMDTMANFFHNIHDIILQTIYDWPRNKCFKNKVLPPIFKIMIIVFSQVS